MGVLTSKQTEVEMRKSWQARPCDWRRCSRQQRRRKKMTKEKLCCILPSCPPKPKQAPYTWGALKSFESCHPRPGDCSFGFPEHRVLYSQTCSHARLSICADCRRGPHSDTGSLQAKHDIYLHPISMPICKMTTHFCTECIWEQAVSWNCST